MLLPDLCTFFPSLFSILFTTQRSKLTTNQQLNITPLHASQNRLLVIIISPINTNQFHHVLFNTSALLSCLHFTRWSWSIQLNLTMVDKSVDKLVINCVPWSLHVPTYLGQNNHPTNHSAEVSVGGGEWLWLWKWGVDWWPPRECKREKEWYFIYTYM